jgi:tetratricopeptide (TPR) repeat protein
MTALSSLQIALGVFVMLAVFCLLAWIFWRCLKNSDDPSRLLFRWIITAVVLGGGGYGIYQLAGDGTAAGQIMGVLAGAVVGLILAGLWLPAIVGQVSDTIGSLYTGGREPPTPKPVYSIAEARRKQGRYPEAVHEIQKELAKFPTDVTGQMLLAEVQAENLHDLESVQATIEGFLTQEHAPKNIAFALNSLADWQLKLAKDTAGARRSLERIVESLPDTEESRNAAQRIAHLATPEELSRRETASLIALPEGRRNLGLEENPQLQIKTHETPDDALARLSGHLAEHPLDREAREKLALVYAEDLQQLEPAVEQFEILSQMPNQTPRDVAHWINRIADLQVGLGLEYEVIRTTLQRIIDLFPGLAPAELAQQRMETLRLELKGKQKSQVVKLGSYEKDIGLKNQGYKPFTDGTGLGSDD